MTLLKRNAGLVLLPLLVSLSSNAIAKGEVTTITTELRSATPSSYTVDGKTYEWGAGEELLIKSIEFNGETLEYGKVKPDAVVIRRVANSKSTGTPCSVFAATLGSDFKFQASYPGDSSGTGNCDYGSVISSNVINIGPLDLFANTAREYSIKNIERVDLIYSKGLIAKSDTMGNSGYAVLEKKANNHVQVAAITALDADGNPQSYGPLVMVRPSEYSDSSEIRYGVAYERQRFAYLSNENRAPQGFLVESRVTEESMGVAFVSLTDLGLTSGQKYFGISLFGADVDPNKSELTDPRTFPLDTGIASPVILESGVAAENAGDADVIVGTVGDIVRASDGGGDNGAGAGTGSGDGDVAQDTETKEVLDIVETKDTTVDLKDGGGGAFGLPVLVVMLLGGIGRCVFRYRPSVAVRRQQG